MATVQHFTELRIWKEGMEIFASIYELTSYPAFESNHRLRAQMRSSSGAIADNIAEGFGRAGRPEFIHSLFIAKGEACELMTQVSRCQMVHLISPDLAASLLSRLDQLSKGIHQLANYLKQSELKGHKFKNRSS